MRLVWCEDFLVWILLYQNDIRDVSFGNVVYRKPSILCLSLSSLWNLHFFFIFLAWNLIFYNKVLQKSVLLLTLHSRNLTSLFYNILPSRLNLWPTSTFHCNLHLYLHAQLQSCWIQIMFVKIMFKNNPYKKQSFS